jgi:GYF domain 2
MRHDLLGYGADDQYAQAEAWTRSHSGSAEGAVVRAATVGTLAASKTIRRTWGKVSLILFLGGIGVCFIMAAFEDVIRSHVMTFEHGKVVLVLGLVSIFLGVVGMFYWGLGAIGAAAIRTVARDVKEDFGTNEEPAEQEPVAGDEDRDRLQLAKEWYLNGDLSETALRIEIQSAFPDATEERVDYLLAVIRSEKQSAAAASDGWLVEKHGLRLGPVSFATLRGWAGEGTLKPTDLICMAGSQDWVPAQTMSSLFAASGGS